MPIHNDALELSKYKHYTIWDGMKANMSARFGEIPLRAAKIRLRVRVRNIIIARPPFPPRGLNYFLIKRGVGTASFVGVFTPQCIATLEK
jgi:hypothetical protein